jgi:hypothetical protein
MIFHRLKRRWILVVAVIFAIFFLPFVIVMFIMHRESRPSSARSTSSTSSTSIGPSVSFVTDPSVLRKSCESYFRGFNRFDAAARGCDRARGPTSCIDAYLSALRRPTDADQLRMTEAVAVADAALLRHFPPATGNAGNAGDAGAAARTPWRIALLDDRAESGFPHTHGDVICMPLSSADPAAWDDRRLAKTLVHERVHVVQRADPARFFDAIAAASSGRVAIASLPSDSDVARRRRSNPDLDAFLYVDAATGLPYAMLFDDDEKSVRVRGLAGSARIAWVDLRGNEVVDHDSDRPPPPKYEHPYEKLAYEIADRCASSINVSFPDDGGFATTGKETTIKDRQPPSR